ncbi:multiple C2 and transmembrane domain-containing protein 2 isoform 2-T2 [Menidia menidia]
METKKMNILENLRLKTKLPNMKKPRKKPLAKQGRNLAHRRSISVPDLSLIASESSLFTISPGLSDTDSIASGSTIDGPLFMDKLNEADTDIVLRVPPRKTPSAGSNRTDTPIETSSLHEETSNMLYSGPESKMNSSPKEAIYTHWERRARRQAFSFEPIPAPRNVFTNLHRPDQEDRVSLSSVDKMSSDNLVAAMRRTNFAGDEMNPHTDRRAVSFEIGTPSANRDNVSVDRMALLDAPLERADRASPDSAFSFPSEEQVNVPWSAEWEEDQEPCTPSLMREFSMEEGLIELDEPSESLEEMIAETGDFFDESIDLGSSDGLNPDCEVQTPGPFQRYLLSINLKQGRNLVIRDKRSGTSDPYVKFKLEGKQFYKSKVVYKNLNPQWNESFTHPLRDREHVVEVRVYDKNRTADDFMGSSTISLKNLELHKTYEMELSLVDPKSKENDMGVIIVDVCLMFRDATIKRGYRFRPKKNKNQAARPADAQKNQLKNKVWTSVLHITLVEGQDLPQYGQGDIYVRFRLGDQKYKSKNLCIQANPQWREEFDFNQFEDIQEPLQVEVFSKRGRKSEESWGMFEVDLSRLPPDKRQLYTHVLDPGKGKLVFLVTPRPCWGVSLSEIDNASLANPNDRNTITEKFSVTNTHKCFREIGFLQVNVLKANDLSATELGKSNPLCVIELGNCKLQTDAISRTLNPEWNKAFTFPIKDIHDVVELSVFDENGDKSSNFLGKVAIPLLSVKNGQLMCLSLKKEDLESSSKGTITLVLEVIYNKVRAGIRTFQPKEAKLIEDNPKFNKKVLARNIYRVRKISTAVLYTLQYIKSCFQWESTQRSLIAFLIFLLTVWNWDLFMLPLFLLLLIIWNYVQITTGKASSNQDLVNMTMGDDEEEDEKESGKKGLMDKIHMVQEVVLVVQTVLDELANIGERIKNIFNWSVPFLSILAGLVLFGAAALLYFVPLRYIVLIWGINKFTKKLRNPYTIDNNEILDFLRRAPSDVQKVQYSVLRAPTGQNQLRKKK